MQDMATRLNGLRIASDRRLTRWLGAATAALTLAPVLAVDPAAGVTLAVVRKIRNLFWSGVGLTIIVAHPARRTEKDPRRASDPLPAAPATDPHESASAHRP